MTTEPKLREAAVQALKDALKDMRAIGIAVPESASLLGYFVNRLNALSQPERPNVAHATVEEWERELSAVMPADFKDWHENSRKEWPVVARGVIEALRESEAFWIESAGRIKNEQPSVERADSPDDIRALGWVVAVHNDYRLHGKVHTFWLFTKSGCAVKGEGETDAVALNQVRALLFAESHSAPVAVVDKTIPSAEIQYTQAAPRGLPHGTELYTLPAAAQNPLTEKEREWIVATCLTPARIIDAVEAAYRMKGTKQQ